MALWKIVTMDGPRLASGPATTGPLVILPAGVTIDGLLAAGRGEQFAEASAREDGEAVTSDAVLQAPIGSQEVWAAGVTYLRSRDARMQESDAPDHYDRVSVSDRPELFFKAPAWRVRASGESIGIRDDSSWDVPEPELAVVADAHGQIVAYSIGNDVSSRSIEGANPLYLPQAKVYTDSAALGPCLVPVQEAPAWEDLIISLHVIRDAVEIIADELPVTAMKRHPQELVEWLYRALDFPTGAVLLTGTGIVPSENFTLCAGDEVRITITGLGELRNTVRTIRTGVADR